MALIADGIVDQGRCLLAALEPLTGTRAAGNVTVTAPAASQVALGSYLIPVVGGQLRQDLVYKVDANAGSADETTWDAPGDVRIISNIGGLRYNLPAGTEMRWDPVVPGINPTVVVAAGGIAGGLDPTGPIALYRAMLFETAQGLKGIEFFRASFPKCPGVLAMWSDSEPADGLATSAVSRGASRKGEGKQVYSETWFLDIIVDRSDSEPARRAQGIRLLEEVTSLLTDRQSVDGVVISFPSGIQIRRRSQLQLPRDIAQLYQVYVIELAAVLMYTRRDARTWADLTAFNVDVPKDATPDDKPLVVGMRIPNT